ncbi:MAG: hypothetical protein ILP13_09590, partial [Lachnospiraceae bacterium]|nr:hypothetical protein [Lachnospiraceae bacterium]
KGLMLAGFEGGGSLLTVPERVSDGGADYTVTGVDRKALLNSNLKAVSLPPTIESIGDWAFSKATHLKRFVLRGPVENLSKVTLGKGIFEGDTALESVCLGYEQDDDLSYLLAATVLRLPAAFLLRTGNLGTKEWFKSFDASLSSYIAESDFTGYSERILCGEEDISYDGIGSVDGELLGESAAYVREKRKDKSALCLLRLMKDKDLAEETGEVFKDYIRKHALGREDDSAWQALKTFYGDSLEYVELYCNVVKPGKTEIGAMLADMGKQGIEIKSFLIGYRGEDDTGNIMDDLLL